MLKLRFLLSHMFWAFELRVSIVHWYFILQFVIEHLFCELSFWILLIK